MTPILLIFLLQLAHWARTEGDMSKRAALSVCQSHLHKYLHLLLLFIHQLVENPLWLATCIWRISTLCQTFAHSWEVEILKPFFPTSIQQTHWWDCCLDFMLYTDFVLVASKAVMLHHLLYSYMPTPQADWLNHKLMGKYAWVKTCLCLPKNKKDYFRSNSHYFFYLLRFCLVDCFDVFLVFVISIILNCSSLWIPI